MLKKNQIDSMQMILASSYTLLLKTQNYHWNIEGANFYALHLLLEKQYEELFEAIDKIAEAIRTLDVKAKATMKEYQSLSKIREGFNSYSSKEMIQDLFESNKELIKVLMDASDRLLSDPALSDLISSRMKAHKENAWMLEASLR